MKKTFFSCLLTASALLFFTQCKKNDASSATANFSPLTTGSNWTYKYTEGTSAASIFKLTATNKDTLANGKTYKVLRNLDGSSSYLAKVANDYYRFASFPTIGISSFEELYLKDDKNINDTWSGATTFPYQGQNITANLTYTIKEKGVSRTVNGLVFNNVTHVRLDISVLLSVYNVKAGGGDFYYQDGVGLIEDSILVPPPFGPYSSAEEITSYEIK